MILIVRQKHIPVSTYAEASEEYGKIRDESGEGASTFPEGLIVTGQGFGKKKRGRGVAKVSYNGKVWEPGSWTPESKLLYEPR